MSTAPGFPRAETTGCGADTECIPVSVAEGVHDAFLTVLTTGDGFGPDYPFSREDLLAAVTEGVRQAFVETMRGVQP